MKPQDMICTSFILALFLIAAVPIIAQDPEVSVVEEIAELFTDGNAVLNTSTTGAHDGHDGHDPHHHHDMDKHAKAETGDGVAAAAPSHHESPDYTDADRTATIAGSLLMVILVAGGLLIAYILNVYKKRMDDQLQLEV